MTTDKEEKADTEQEHPGTDSFTDQESTVSAIHVKKLSRTTSQELVFNGRAYYFHIHKYLTSSNFCWIIMLVTSTALLIFSLGSFRKISTKD